MTPESVHLLNLAYQSAARHEAFTRGEIKAFEKEHGVHWEQPVSPYEWAISHALIMLAADNIEEAIRLEKLGQSASKNDLMTITEFVEWSGSI